LGTLIINFKNYPEVLGEGSVRLARAAEGVAVKSGVRVVVAPPAPMLALVAAAVKIPVFSQAVGIQTGEKTTGAVLVEAVKGGGAKGTLLNHSESPVPASQVRQLMPRLRRAGLSVCLCAATEAEAVRLSRLGPEYVAIEPPELIGSGIAVSKARPELVSGAVRRLRRAGYGGGVLCGAGIVTGRDVEMAVELGVDGVLVSSSVVKAQSWHLKIDELARSLK
jgi:triosephosphate isomerase (TIM)